MKNLAPEIYRQRLTIEGIYDIYLSSLHLRDFMKQLSRKLKMTVLYGPIVKNLAGKINQHHKGFEAVLIWTESGVTVYTWELYKFFTVDIYSCKKFNNYSAINFTKKFFKTKDKDIVYKNL